MEEDLRALLDRCVSEGTSFSAHLLWPAEIHERPEFINFRAFCNDKKTSVKVSGKFVWDDVEATALFYYNNRKFFLRRADNSELVEIEGGITLLYIQRQNTLVLSLYLPYMHLDDLTQKLKKFLQQFGNVIKPAETYTIPAASSVQHSLTYNTLSFSVQDGLKNLTVEGPFHLIVAGLERHLTINESYNTDSFTFVIGRENDQSITLTLSEPSEWEGRTVIGFRLKYQYVDEAKHDAQ